MNKLDQYGYTTPSSNHNVPQLYIISRNVGMTHATFADQLNAHASQMWKCR